MHRLFIHGSIMNRFISTVSLGLLLGLLLFVPFELAQAQQKTNTPLNTEIEQRRVVRLSNNTTTTSISGNSSSYTTALRADRHYVLAALAFSERGDAPCYVTAQFMSRRHGRVEPLHVETDLCERSINDIRGVSVGNPGPLAAIHALKVGLNRKGNKLKAVATEGSTIDQDDAGEVRRDPGLSDSFQRPNFKRPWKTKVSCEEGEVAVGLVIHYRPNNTVGFHTHPSIEGLALECAAVSVHEWNYREGTDERVRRLPRRND
jgi:hypothetical protein